MHIVNDNILDVPKMWQNERLHKKDYLQLLQNDYEYTRYDNNYKMNLAIFFLKKY
jgi:hypothetical protein